MAVTSNCWIDQGSQNVSGNYTTCVFRGDITASGSSYNNYTRTGSGSFNGVSFSFSTTIPANTETKYCPDGYVKKSFPLYWFVL